jgi:hypothetical protein
MGAEGLTWSSWRPAKFGGCVKKQHIDAPGKVAVEQGKIDGGIDHVHKRCSIGEQVEWIPLWWQRSMVSTWMFRCEVAAKLQRS